MVVVGASPRVPACFSPPPPHPTPTPTSSLWARHVSRWPLPPLPSWPRRYDAARFGVWAYQLVDGTLIEDSRARGRPFQFKVGVGQVVKGMDIAIKQMSRGQRAKVVIPGALAYGEAGAYPLIPSNASMIFEVRARTGSAHNKGVGVLPWLRGACTPGGGPTTPVTTCLLVASPLPNPAPVAG